MPRDFNIKFDNAELLGGADNLLEGTKVTKVVLRGENKFSSLDSTFENCTELDTIDGSLSLNDISNANELLKDTPYVKTVNVRDINNENMTITNSFDTVETLNVDGNTTKKGMQNLLSQMDWNTEKHKYVGEMISKTEILTETKMGHEEMVLVDTVERANRGLEIEGETYNNLIIGDIENKLVNPYDFTSNAYETKEIDYEYESPFNIKEVVGNSMHNVIKNPNNEKEICDLPFVGNSKRYNIDNSVASKIRVDELTGETYQNLVKNGRNEIVLSDVTKLSMIVPLYANVDYTLRLSSVGKGGKNIIANLGGTEFTITPTDNVKTEHSVAIRTPSALVDNELEFFGQGVKINDVELFRSTEVDTNGYIEGVKSIGEWSDEDNAYKIEILSRNTNKVFGKGGKLI